MKRTFNISNKLSSEVYYLLPSSIMTKYALYKHQTPIFILFMEHLYYGAN